MTGQLSDRDRFCCQVAERLANNALKCMHLAHDDQQTTGEKTVWLLTSADLYSQAAYAIPYREVKENYLWLAQQAGATIIAEQEVVEVIPLNEDGSVGARRTIVDFGDQAGCDGMCVDEAGNLYLTARSVKRPGVLVVDPNGKEIAFIPTGPANQVTDATHPAVGMPSAMKPRRPRSCSVSNRPARTTLSWAVIGRPPVGSSRTCRPRPRARRRVQTSGEPASRRGHVRWCQSLLRGCHRLGGVCRRQHGPAGRSSGHLHPAQ